MPETAVIQGKIDIFIQKFDANFEMMDIDLLLLK